MNPVALPILYVLVGLCLLFFGRKLFWLLVAALGFLVAIWLASEVFHAQPQPWAIIIAVAVGLLGAVLAVFLQKIAIGVAGMVAGGYAAFLLMNRFGTDTSHFPWIPVVIGAIIGAILLAMLFEWALILLSSVTGAYLIAQVLDGGFEASLTLFAVLSVIGIIVQARSKVGKHRKKSE
jgi:hypothetical protein